MRAIPVACAFFLKPSDTFTPSKSQPLPLNASQFILVRTLLSYFPFSFFPFFLTVDCAFYDSSFFLTFLPSPLSHSFLFFRAIYCTVWKKKFHFLNLEAALRLLSKHPRKIKTIGGIGKREKEGRTINQR